MKILFVTFGELQVRGSSARPAAVVRALVDAGHRVSIIAARVDIPKHPNMQVLAGQEAPVTERRLRMAATQAASSMKFDAVHAVDAAAPFCMQICLLRKIPLIYDASRCFTGKNARPPSRRWKWFPKHYAAKEQKLLRKAAGVITADAVLARELEALSREVRVTRIEDVPLQSLFACPEDGRNQLNLRLKQPVTSIVVCRVEALSSSDLRKLLMAVRKVIDSMPDLSFVFRGVSAGEAGPMAASLDIEARCCFLEPEEVELYLCALQAAAASVLVPTPDRRYVSPEIYTLLNAPAPLVHVQSSAHDGLLDEQNSVPVLLNTDAMAEGLLRVLREPLFSLGLAAEGRQLIADHYSLSSFKHKIRMLYHETLHVT